MTPAERELSENRRKLIFEQNRANNPPRPNRLLPQNDRADELLARIGVIVPDDDRPVDWKALTASA